MKSTIINGWLDLSSLTTVDKDFLKGTTINGPLYLHSLTTVDKDFLKNTILNGSLDLDSLTIIDKNFLKNATINGSLYLHSLTTIDKNFLKSTTLNDNLISRSLTAADKKIVNNNVKKLEVGYNKEGGYCYFDGILSKVLSVSEKKGYILFITPFEFIAQKGNYTAHGSTIKKAIQDVEFKIIAEKLKKEPITENTELTVKYYRLLTGACDSGCRNWMQNNNIPFKVVDNSTVELEPIKAKDLLPLLQKTNAYGLQKIKELINF